MRNKILFSLIMVLVVVSMFGIVSSEMLVSDVGVEYDSEIVDALDNSELAEVMVELSFSNLSLINSLLSNFTEEEFKLKRILRGDDAFVGNITKEGLNKLINNPNVEFVFLSKILQVHPAQNEVEIEQDVLVALNNSEWVEVIIKLQSKNDTIRDSVLANLSGLEFKLKEKLLREDAFVGNITKEGLDKLIKNPEVRLIYLNKIWHILENETSGENEDVFGNETTEELQEPIDSEKQNLIWLWILVGVIFIVLVIIYLKFIQRK